jgi:hypothetical protein
MHEVGRADGEWCGGNMHVAYNLRVQSSSPAAPSFPSDQWAAIGRQMSLASLAGPTCLITDAMPPLGAGSLVT